MIKAERRFITIVMPGLVPGIHVLTVRQQGNTWMAGTSPAMTAYRLDQAEPFSFLVHSL
jgi:hypothetical protein